MAKPTTIRFDEDDREYLNELVKLLGQETGEALELAAALRKAAREALERRGVIVPEGVLTIKKEGRPKENAPLSELVGAF